jgi:hypothetical protein
MKTLFLLPLLLAACGEAREAVAVTVPVETAPLASVPVTSDLGYAVTLTRARAAVRDLEFTIEGEQHSLLRRLLLPEAYAHPGHAAGGKVTGELPGPHLVSWGGQAAPLGGATMLTGAYHGANFTFRRAADADGLSAGDPLIGHSVHLEGTATRDGRTVPFSAVVDIDDGTRLIGAPFDLELIETHIPTVHLEILPQDPTEPDTLFDRIDFLALGGERADIAPGTEAHNVLKRNLQVHDHYRVTP